MKSTHRQFLGRAVRIAVNTRASEWIKMSLSAIKHPRSPICELIIDIVSDARFFRVTDSNDGYWYAYGSFSISRFIDQIPAHVWADSEKLTLAKEDFLNHWLVDNIEELSVDKRANWLEMYLPKNQSNDEDEESDEVFGATDYTDGGDVYEPTELEPELSDYLKSSGRGEGKEHNAEAEYLKSIPPSLVRLAEMIGRSSAMPVKNRSRFHSSPRSDIDGITVGNDLNSLLPTEVSLLGSPVTENVFYQRFAQKRLQIFSSASQIAGKPVREKYGPIYVCIDTSSSMTGAHEAMAKKLALAVCIVAQRRKRPVCLVNYSNYVSFFILQNLDNQRADLLRFLSHSYGGGNEEDNLFRFLFIDLPKSKRYKHLVEKFDGADLLIVSDFMWALLERETEELIMENHSAGTKFYGLSVIESEEYFDGHEAFDYLRDCDGAYSYQNGIITELNRKKC